MSQPTLAPWQQKLVMGLQRFIYWISKHWLALANFFIFLYVGLPVAAPVFMRIGWTGPANVIYTVAKPMCHQLSFRSIPEGHLLPRRIVKSRTAPTGLSFPGIIAFAVIDHIHENGAFGGFP